MSHHGCDQEFVKSLLSVNRVMLHTTGHVEVKLQYKKGEAHQLSAVIRMPISEGYDLLSVIKFPIIESTNTGEPSKIRKTGKLITTFISTPFYFLSHKKGSTYTPLRTLRVEPETAQDTVYRICTGLLKHFRDIKYTSKEKVVLRDLAFSVKKHFIDYVFIRLNNNNISDILTENMQQRVQNAVDIFYDLSLCDVKHGKVCLEKVQPFMVFYANTFYKILSEALKRTSSESFLRLVKRLCNIQDLPDSHETGLDVTNPYFLPAAAAFLMEQVYKQLIKCNTPVKQLISIFQCLSEPLTGKI